jgi:hypothetical protein
MLRVPSEIAADQFESLKIQSPGLSQGLTFVAYRSDVYPSRNEVFFEENAVIYVLEKRGRFLCEAGLLPYVRINRRIL